MKKRKVERREGGEVEDITGIYDLTSCYLFFALTYL